MVVGTSRRSLKMDPRCRRTTLLVAAVVLPFLAVVLAEYGLHYAAAVRCRWPMPPPAQLKSNDSGGEDATTVLRLLVLADTHLLGYNFVFLLCFAWESLAKGRLWYSTQLE